MKLILTLFAFLIGISSIPLMKISADSELEVYTEIAKNLESSANKRLAEAKSLDKVFEKRFKEIDSC